MEVVIAVGSNLGDRLSNIYEAKKRVEARLGKIVACSSIWQTEPVVASGRDSNEEPVYLNLVMVVETRMQIYRVLDLLLEIEIELGRNRDKQILKWASRTIDLDIIACGDLTISSERLTIPHLEMHKRLFVLGPMMEIRPMWRHPVLGKTVEELRRSLP
ncbi:MAG: 2-amino-4-hydroxy-6-hydroxymethyldihydropteridine diphosphokinase [Deltaproteobacteria bacterium]|nr:2-amino-4-hydroxy-6-hydroxymethyldihydropteridine diphosphokinase [Deltaproteobacteria bacterium]